jgi:hypothetical protein
MTSIKVLTFLICLPEKGRRVSWNEARVPQIFNIRDLPAVAQVLWIATILGASE